MRYTLAANSAAEVTHTLISNLPFSLSRTALELYRTMHTAGVEVSRSRGYHAKVSEVHLFCPGEVVAAALGIARSTLYLKLDELREHGLLDARGHYTTHRGRTVADGMVWCVRMRPARGRRARVSYDALKARYRDLGADIEAGRTAWAHIGQSNLRAKRPVDTLGLILSWALPPIAQENPISKTVRYSLETVLDVPFVERSARNVAVDSAARAMAAHLRDAGGLNFYRWLVWQLLRLEDRGQGGQWHTVYQMARRASVDAAEGFARKPGALFTTRLKRAPWWEELRRCPAYRVGLLPEPS